MEFDISQLKNGDEIRIKPIDVLNYEKENKDHDPINNTYLFNVMETCRANDRILTVVCVEDATVIVKEISGLVIYPWMIEGFYLKHGEEIEVKDKDTEWKPETYSHYIYDPIDYNYQSMNGVGWQYARPMKKEEPEIEVNPNRVWTHDDLLQVCDKALAKEINCRFQKLND